MSSLDAIFIDLEAGIVQSYEEEGEEGQLNQDRYATLPRATLPFNTVCFIASTRDKSLNTIVDLEAGIVQSDEKEGKEGPLNQDHYATPPPATISFTTIISLTSTHKKSLNKNVDPKKVRKTSRGPGVKLQGNWGNTKHIAPNFLKRNSTISGLDEGHKGQRNEQKAKKAKKAHESRFDLDEVLMDAPASLPDMAAYFPNLSSKRRWQSVEARQVAEKQPKRAKRCLHTKDIEDDVMMDVNPAESRIPAVASPAPPKATNTSLKRGVGTPKAKEATISSKMAKKPKQKHEGKLPIDVCVEFEDITQLVDARMREKEERRQEERVRREAPRILKRSQGRAAAEAAEEAEKSAKRPKTAKDAEEAKTPELRRAFKRARGSDGKLNHFSTVQVTLLTVGSPASFERHPRMEWREV